MAQIKNNKIMRKQHNVSDDFFLKSSDEVNICLTCTEPNCKGICTRYKQEIKKVKGKK